MKTKIKKPFKNERGVAAFIALALVVMLTGIGVIAIRNSNDEVNLAGNERENIKAFYAAEAELERVAAVLKRALDSTGAPPTDLPIGKDSYNGYDVWYVTQDDGPAKNEVLSTGSFTGLNALIKTYSVTSISKDVNTGSTVQLEESFQVSLVPIFQFAIFYENDLEIHPGPDMTLTGRVHSNSDIYLGAGNSLSIDSRVTSAGDLLYGSHPASGQSDGTGLVQIKDASGDYQAMNSGGTILDASSSDWYDSSVARWGGTVQDAAYGQEKLKLPLDGSNSPRSIIEPSNGGANPNSFEDKATVKIINQQVLQQFGSTWIDVTSTAVAEGWYSTNNDAFTDFRESAEVDAVEIDMTLFKTSTIFPSNGVLYVSDDDASRDFPALQLKNGADIGYPINFVSENPIYIEGDFNTINKQPAAFMGDAVTFLSNNWNSNKGNPSMDDRDAAATTVNASFVTGNVPSSGGQYSGGVENLPRFLEDWSSKDFNWSGSMVNMWESQQANSQWSGAYYSPPNRNWSFDNDLTDPNKLPPESPMIRVFSRIGWKHNDIQISDPRNHGVL